MLFLVLEIHKDNFLVVADSYQQHLYQVPLNNGGTNALVTSRLYRPIAVAFDPITQKVHWTDNEAKVVKSAYLSGKSDIVLQAHPDSITFLLLARFIIKGIVFIIIKTCDKIKISTKPTKYKSK